MPVTSCIVCGVNVIPVADATHVIGCPVCGPYRVSGTIFAAGISDDRVPHDKRYVLSAWIRDRYRHNEAPPQLTTENVKTIVANAPEYTPEERLRRLLVNIGKQVGKPGVAFQANQVTAADAWARDAGEVKEYLRWLDRDELTIPVGGNAAQRHLTRKGWQEFDRLTRATEIASRRAFVAMWFDDSMDSAWTDGLRAAIVEAGFTAYRIKEDIHDEKIDARIITAIRESRFVVADVTGARPAVYYEAGYAEGLGKPVIWTCRRANQADMNFDTRQYLHILWNDPADLRAKLTPVIKARIA